MPKGSHRSFPMFGSHKAGDEGVDKGKFTLLEINLKAKKALLKINS
jgi:hypothetical protein